MLILTRKPGESLFIGDAIKVTVMEIKGNQIRIGIDAPKDLRIYREEIYLQILEENRSASDVSAAGSLGSFGFMLNDQAAGKGDSDSNGKKKPGAIGNLVVKKVSGLNLAKGKGMLESSQGTEGMVGVAKIETSKPDIVVKRKKKPTDSE